MPGQPPHPGDGIYRSHAADLTPLMETMASAGTVRWRADELGEILEHQLAAPLLFDLRSLDSGERRSLEALAEQDGASLNSFGDLLFHPQPPIPLLELVKEFAKSSDTRPDIPLPVEIATILYYAAIVAALLQHGCRITSLDNPTLSDGVEWALRQPWVAGPARGLFVRARHLLCHETGPPPAAFRPSDKEHPPASTN